MYKFIETFAWSVVVAVSMAGGIRADDATNVARDEQMLRAAHVATDGPALIELIRKQTKVSANRQHIQELIHQLGDDSFERRQKASSSLCEIGDAAGPLLRHAARHDDPEIAHRAQDCLQRIRFGKSASVPLLLATVRLIAVRKPAGTVEALLAYLPNADDAVAEEIRVALSEFARPNGSANPILVAALQDKEPLRRGAAAVALLRAGVEEVRPVIHDLLCDPEAIVRLPLALHYFELHDADAVPVLIDGLADSSTGLRGRIEETLLQWAGGFSPSIPAETPASRRRQLWQDWWQKNDSAALTAFFQRSKVEALSDVVEGAARVLALKNPANGTDVLLAYLSFANDDGEVEAIAQTLTILARKDERVVKQIAVAVADKSATKRAVAADVLCRCNRVNDFPQVLKLLQDPEPLVRLRVALALAPTHKEAIPVLISLLAEVRLEHAWAAERALLRLAGRETPTVTLQKDLASRNSRDAWMGWWRKNEANADLTRLRELPPFFGYTLMLILSQGQAQEIDAEGRLRWRVSRLQQPLDIQYLPGDRLLTAEHNANRVAERNLRGEIIWLKEIEEPYAAQRLANGNTMISTQTGLVEVDREGREVLSVPFPGERIMRLQKLPTGEIALILNGLEQRFVLLDPAGKETIRTFPVLVNTSGGRFDVHPDGRVLLTQKDNDKVVEYDAQGKILKQLSVEQSREKIDRKFEPVSVVRMFNGNLLVTSMKSDRLVEFDPDGKIVWSFRQDPSRPVTRAYRR